MPHILRHEQLHAYQLSRAVSLWIRNEARFPRGEASLRDQAKRAADSVALNLAEASYREGKDRLHHFRIAMGSAAECCAVLDLIEVPGSDETQKKLRRVVAMISKLP